MSSACSVQLPGLSCAQGRMVLIGLGVGVVLVALLPMIAKNARNIGEAAGGAVIEFADGALGEVVQDAGEIIGIPRTDKTQCQLDIEAGRWWDASFSCPAGDFLKGVFR